MLIIKYLIGKERERKTMIEKKLITDEMIANYHKAVIKFNEDIKKERKFRQTLCENFISKWADVIEEIGIRNRKELENEKRQNTTTL